VRVSTVIATAALAVLAVLGVAAPASAHDQLLSTDPEDGSTVATMPAAVTLTFNDLVQDAGAEANQVRVMDASCTVISDGDVQITDNVVTQPVSGSATGPVTVLWRIVSRDGHPVSGEFSFTVGDASAAASPTPCATDDATSSTAQTAETSATPWIIGGIVLVVIVAGVIVLLVTRSRRPDDQ
jgi:methionine-rich copper-binding protein CopC